MNLEISPAELAQVRELDDFDLTMVLSEIHDHGWPIARVTLQMALAATRGVALDPARVRELSAELSTEFEKGDA